MNINPFDLLKNAKALQEKMGDIQQRLENLNVTGTAGGGMARVTLNGKLEMVDIVLEKEAVDPEDIILLQDLIKAAYRDAAEKAKEAIQQEMGPLAGGLGMPTQL
jgi:nucleoid-associated protein EbfC